MPPLPSAWADGLLEAGAGTVFGVAGSANFVLLAHYRDIGGRYVAAQHEAGAVAMAAGFASTDLGIGVASVHQGPGLTNALTALVDAQRAGLPVVLLAGHADDPSHHQWIDAVGIAAASGIETMSPRADARSLAALIDDVRTSPRAVLVLPPGISGGGRRSPEVPPIHEMPAQVIANVDAAHRIAIIAGRGALRAQALSIIEELADHLDAMLVTSAPTMGAFAGNPRAAGITGGFASEATIRALRSCDAILTFGASLDAWSTAGGRVFAEGARVMTIGLAADATVRMDAKQAAECLRGATRPRVMSGWVQAAAAEARLPRSYEPATGLDPRSLLAQLDARLPVERWMSFDSGHFLAIATMTMTSISGPTLQFGQDFQSVGLGLGHAIGASAADPNRVAVAVIGDGGAAMSIPEIATAVDLGLPLLVIVVNDGGYGAEVHDFAPLGLPVSIAQWAPRDWAGVSRALGAQAVTVRSLADLDVLGTWHHRGPLVLDCHVDASVDAVSIMAPEGQAEWSHVEP